MMTNDARFTNENESITVMENEEFSRQLFDQKLGVTFK